MSWSSITRDELIGRIKAKLESKPHKGAYGDFRVAPAPTEPAAYVLISGAGLSYGVVPLVRDLMEQTIGDYYYPDQDMPAVKRPVDALRKLSAGFWAEFNEAALKAGLPKVELTDEGLPKSVGDAYQYLFTYEGANVLFAQLEPTKPSYAARLERLRARGQEQEPEAQKPPEAGKKFVNGFLRYVMDAGTEHGYGSTGRTELNPAHIYLAALLEAQQLGGRGWATIAFSRTLLTTNFDTPLQNALQMVNLLYRLTDRPEQGIDPSALDVEEGPIHVAYLHGSILRHNPASTIAELGGLEKKNIGVLRGYLESRDIITIGYSGWHDGLMAALRGCDSSQHTLYWCDITSQPPSHVSDLLKDRAGKAVYVNLGKEAADGFMRALYEALIPAEVQRDPMRRYRNWKDLMWNR
jgi:hypothetical protein